ncbi:DUF431-domain-containing protein [Trichodelitschia bisporula]|uniref:DUF431-domain-containing protein n=1 Tax=Trichodelitschia bisporula TaxID=703511 RepID=A0A6G1HTA1_9PEZI|nr:DUF431-domain-containing protein [Trichodelitschia bisporula]
MPSSKTFVVEHLDTELGPWSTLEYATIAAESAAAGAGFILSSVPSDLVLPPSLSNIPGLQVKTESVETLFPKPRVCLLDPAAGKELAPVDGDVFDVFLFGGILGDDPPRDRTGELRRKGYEGRRLGPVQMTTDTAVRVTRMVVQEQTPLEDIKFVDHPEIRVSAHESTEMPFRYVVGNDGKPIMPEGMVELIKKDSEKSIDDLF